MLHALHSTTTVKGEWIVSRYVQSFRFVAVEDGYTSSHSSVPYG
jgi:hypothetical protein